MTDPPDVAGRLADGLSVVQDAQTYVWACHLRGYQNPDLTSHGVQVGEWYGTEDGLDLGALDADCGALGAAARTLGEALRLARAQVVELPQAWTGPGALAAADFLRRHCDSAAVLVEAVTIAAQSAATLRDELWRVVDHKVETTAAIADRTQGHRSSWLAAAREVLAGDSTAQDAAQVLDSQVKPFVDNDIGGQWVPEMRATVAAASEAYRVALGALATAPGVRFDIPGDLGPTYDGPTSHTFAPAPTPTATPASAPADAPVTPMGAVSPMPPAAMASPSPTSEPPNALEPLLSPGPAPAPAVPAEAPGPLTSTGAMPGLGSAGEIPARVADALGGLLSPSSGPQPDALADLAEPAEIDVPDTAEDEVGEDPGDEDAADDAPEDDAPEDDAPENDLADEDQANEDQADEDQTGRPAG